MRTLRYTEIARILILLGMMAFFSFGFLGLGHTDMSMRSDGEMSTGNCFMPGMTAALCQMNPLEHIATWQSMFTAVPSQNDILLLLASLLALVFGALYIAHRSIAPPKALILQSAFAYYKRRVPIIHPLQEALSNGILHPKIF